MSMTEERRSLADDIVYIFTHMGTVEQLAFIFCYEAVRAGTYKKELEADYYIRARRVPESERKTLIAYFWEKVGRERAE